MSAALCFGSGSLMFWVPEKRKARQEMFLGTKRSYIGGIEPEWQAQAWTGFTFEIKFK